MNTDIEEIVNLKSRIESLEEKLNHVEEYLSNKSELLSEHKCFLEKEETILQKLVSFLRENENEIVPRSESASLDLENNTVTVTVMVDSTANSPQSADAPEYLESEDRSPESPVQYSSVIIYAHDEDSLQDQEQNQDNEMERATHRSLLHCQREEIYSDEIPEGSGSQEQTEDTEEECMPKTSTLSRQPEETYLEISKSSKPKPKLIPNTSSSLSPPTEYSTTIDEIPSLRTLIHRSQTDRRLGQRRTKTKCNRLAQAQVEDQGYAGGRTNLDDSITPSPSTTASASTSKNSNPDVEFNTFVKVEEGCFTGMNVPDAVEDLHISAEEAFSNGSSTVVNAFISVQNRKSNHIGAQTPGEIGNGDGLYPSIKKSPQKRSKRRPGEKEARKRVYRGVPDKTPQTCHICERRLRTIHGLIGHMRCHTGEKPHKCQHCCAEFGQKSSLTRHLLAHAGERNYICALCDKGFITKYDLFIHSRTHASGRRAQTCPTCSKSFFDKRYFQTHVKVCASESKIKCPICEKLFKDPKYFRKHASNCRTSDAGQMSQT